MDSAAPPSTMTSIALSNNCENINLDQFVEQLHQKNRMGKNFASKLSLYQQQLKNINSFAHRYDPKLGLKTNGFRSFLKVRQDFNEICSTYLDTTYLPNPARRNSRGHFLTYVHVLTYLRTILVF